MSEEIPQEFSREQFEERSIEVTDGEVRALNQALHEMVRAFRTGEPHAHIVDDLGENYDPERMALLLD